MSRTQLWASGGGVQSAAIAALIVQGHIRPDLAVIVDTEREQSTTWAYMDEVISPALATVGVVLHRVKKSEYEKKDLYGGKDDDTLLIPAFTNLSGDVGKLPTYCSSYWKREVVKRWGNAQGVKAVDQWLGISVDEMSRVQADKGKWATRYPLIERAMNRGDCVALVKRMGWPEPPRSSCYMCPNHTQHEWRDIRDNKPDDWQAAIVFDRDMRLRDPNAFLHHDAVPLEQADLDERAMVCFSTTATAVCVLSKRTETTMTSLPTPEEQCRQQFEAWALRSIDGGCDLSRYDFCDEYVHPPTQRAWEAWSAAHRLYAPALPEPTE